MQGSIRNVPTKNSNVTFSIYDRVFKILTRIMLSSIVSSPQMFFSNYSFWSHMEPFCQVCKHPTCPDGNNAHCKCRTTSRHRTYFSASSPCNMGHIAEEQKHSRQPIRDAGEGGLPLAKTTTERGQQSCESWGAGSILGPTGTPPSGFFSLFRREHGQELASPQHLPVQQVTSPSLLLRPLLTINPIPSQLLTPLPVSQHFYVSALFWRPEVDAHKYT